MDKKKKNLVILAKIRNNCNSCALLPRGNSRTYFYKVKHVLTTSNSPTISPRYFSK